MGMKNIKKFFSVLLSVVCIITLFGCSNKTEQVDIKKMAKETYDWPDPDTELSKLAPKPISKYGKLERDNDKLFSVYIYSNKDEFKDYVKKCRESEFTKDHSATSDCYIGYNENGNMIRVDYVEKSDEHPEEYQISVYAPEEKKTDNSNQQEKKTNSDSGKKKTAKKDKESSTNDNKKGDVDNTSNTSEQQTSSETQENTEVSPLSKDGAQDGFERYGESAYPYGFKPHWLLGVLAFNKNDDGSYFIKVEVTITNEYGTKLKTNVEGTVSGTDDYPIVNDFYVYS